MDIEESLYPKISASLTQTGAKFPEFLAESFARILQRIELLWGAKEAIDYIDSLFLVDSTDVKNLPPHSGHSTKSGHITRHGFPLEVVKEIVLLKQIHQHLFRLTNLDPQDPFSRLDALAPIDIQSEQTHIKMLNPFSDTEVFTPVNLSAKADAQPEPINANKKRQVDRPAIRTLHELGEDAQLWNEMEEGSEFAQAAILEIIENQIRDDNPREVKQTFERLLSEGHSKEEAIKLVGCAVAIEIFGIVKHQKPYNESRYIENLGNLPEIPWEDDEENGI